MDQLEVLALYALSVIPSQSIASRFFCEGLVRHVQPRHGLRRPCPLALAALDLGIRQHFI